MSTLTITLSDAALARLRDRAAERNTTPEALLSSEAEAREVGDTLLNLLGSIKSAGTDAGERHGEATGTAVVHGSQNGRATEPPANPDDDPLFRLFGTIKADVTDVSERHDEYIGQASTSAKPCTTSCGGLRMFVDTSGWACPGPEPRSGGSR